MRISIPIAVSFPKNRLNRFLLRIGFSVSLKESTKGFRRCTIASAENRLIGEDINMFSLIIELAANTEVKPYIIAKMLRFVAIIVAKNNPTGKKKTAIPKL